MTSKKAAEIAPNPYGFPFPVPDPTKRLWVNTRTQDELYCLTNVPRYHSQDSTDECSAQARNIAGAQR